MSKTLMLVESPHKSSVIGKFLGAPYTVMATVGSMFDIENPTTEANKQKYDSHGVDTKTWDRHLKCSNTKQFALIKKEVASGKYDTLVIATDPDRAGEQIGHEVVTHLKSEIAKHKVKVLRASWNEITKSAVEAGLKAAGPMNMQAVDAATARQIYDRLFGFTLSPVLWRTIARGTSGGRVQSPALRLVVNREKERLAFVMAGYKQVTGLFHVGPSKVSLAAKLLSVGDKRMATGSSFGSDGKVKNGEVVIDDGVWAKLEPFLKRCAYDVDEVSTKPYSRRPPAPYTTSSFQQDVGTRCRLSSKQIMEVAQRLYDAGFVTYMRTDSPALSQEGLDAARAEVVRMFGASSVPSTPNIYKSKAKNAQEGHEALRPTADSKGAFRTPASLKAQLDKMDKNAHKVYECIYNRTVASQMNDAKGFTTTVKIGSTNAPADRKVIFSTSATVFTEPGWTALTKPIVEDDEENATLDAKVNEGEAADLKKLVTSDHSTTPPARFTEPQLVAKLEELGIGRPSTYASIVTVNQTRGYVKKKGQQLYPTWTGMKVAQYLEDKVTAFVNYDATALMEEELDKIEDGSLKMDTFLKSEWAKIQKNVAPLTDNIDWKEVEKLGTIDLHNGYVIRVNSYGAFLEDDSVEYDENGRRAGVKLGDEETVGDLDFTDAEVCKKLFEAGQNRVEARELGELPAGNYKGWTVTARDGKFGPFLQAVDPAGKEKPINHPLPEGKELASVKLADIADLFAEVKLPRFSPDGKIFVGIGKKGAYIGRKNTVKGKASFKPLPENVDPKVVTFDELKKIWDESNG